LSAQDQQLRIIEQVIDRIEQGSAMAAASLKKAKAKSEAGRESLPITYNRYSRLGDN
jgi:hypothetical protein